MPPKKLQEDKPPAQTARKQRKTSRTTSYELSPPHPATPTYNLAKSALTTPTDVYNEGEDDLSTVVHASLKEDDIIASIDEKLIPNIIKRCAISDSDLFNDLSATEIEVLVHRLLPGICQQGKLYLYNI